MTHKMLSGILLHLLIPVTALSASLESALIVPWQQVTQSYQEKNFNFHFLLNNLTLNAQNVPIEIQAIEADIQMVFKPLQMTEIDKQKNVSPDQISTMLETKELHFEIRTPGFKIQKDILRVINGVNVNVHLEAVCGAISMSQKMASAKSDWSWQSSASQSIFAQLENIQLSWPEKSWQFSKIECQGPQGFADLVQMEIEKQLENTSQLEDLLKPKIEKLLNQNIETYLEKWRNPQWIYQSQEVGLNAKMTGLELVSSKGLLFKLLLQIPNQSSGVDPVIELPLDLPLTNYFENSNDLPKLIISKRALELITSTLSANSRWATNLESFSGFNKLLRSRFMQLFVWPDLWNYPKSSKFPMLTIIGKNAEVLFNDKTQLQINAQVQTWVQSERSGKKWNYLYIQNSIAARSELEVREGKLGIQINDVNLSPQLSFYPDYLQTFQPSEFVSKNIIKKAIEEALRQQKISISIPQIKINEMVQVQAEGLRRISDELFMIDLKQITDLH